MTNTANEAVLVEHSDERLAAVEEAKKTGQEFQSVGAKGTDIVDRAVLADAVREQSAVGSSDPDEPLPDYLAELRNAHQDDEQEINARKAQEHNEYSAELARGQQKAAVSDAEKLRQDPDYFSKRIQALNAQLAADYAKTSAAFAKEVARRNDGVQEEVRKLRPERVGDPHPITVLGQNATVTDISESAIAEQLVTRDRITFGEESFKNHATASREEAAEAAPKRAQAPSKTDEPKRIEETTRKAKVEE